MTVEDLDIEAEVVNKFTAPLSDLAESLRDIGRLEQQVFPIEAEAHVGEAISDLTALKAATESIDDDIHIDSDLDVDEIGSAAAATAAPSPGGGGGSGGGIVTSGGRDRDLPDGDTIRTLQRTFGDAFDESEAIRMGGKVGDVQRVIDWDNAVDMDAFSDALRHGDVDMGILRRMGSDDPSTILGVTDELKDLDLAIGDLGRESRSLRRRIQDIQPKMGNFFKLLAALLPLVFAFIGALPAAIAGLAALAVAAVGAAAGLAAIGGLGLLGIGLQGGEFSMEPIQQELSELRDTFIEAFAPLAEMFAPAVRDFIDDIGRLFEAIASRGRVLAEMRDEFRAVGDAMVELIPPLLTGLVALGESLAPVFSDLVGFLANFDWAKLFSDIVEDTIPAFYMIVDAFMAILPLIYELSVGMLWFVGGLTKVIGAVASFLNMLGPLRPLLGFLIGAFLTLVTAMGLYSTIAGWAASVTSLLAGVAIPNAITSLYGYISAQYGATTATLATVAAVTALIGVITFGLAPALSSVLGSMMGVNDELGKTHKQLGRLDGASASVGIGSSGSGGSGGSTNPYHQENNYYVNANSREQANRTTESLSYANTHRRGEADDATHAPQ